MLMNEKQIELARHALGLNGKARCSYRNYFSAGPGHSDYLDWLAMVEVGDARRRESVKGFGGDDLFHLTKAGAEKALLPGERLDPDDFPAPCD
jgi:hypothetical protein